MLPECKIVYDTVDKPPSDICVTKPIKLNTTRRQRKQSANKTRKNKTRIFE
jgi:hypothetical protein